MVFDNRFVPLIQHPYITNYENPSHFTVYAFAATAREAFSSNDDNIGIPEVYGSYNLIDLFYALEIQNIPLPLPLPLINKLQLNSGKDQKILWNVEGRIQAQGMMIGYHQQLVRWMSAGFKWGFMRVNSEQRFFLDSGGLIAKLDEAEISELKRGRRCTQELLGLCGDHSSQVGMGDLDAYIQFDANQDDLYKFRHIYAALRCGTLAPTGVSRNIDQPPSIAFGGDGHWGLYARLETEAEIREDWKVGFFVLFGKRLNKRKNHRLPITQEPVIFGGTTGCARVNPGMTVVFSPYASFENVRGGFGGRLQYTLTSHDKDHWYDARSNKSIPVNVANPTCHSSWASSYVTLTVFYDFGKVRIDRGFAPILIFNWDIPASFLKRRDFSKTQIVSMGLEYNF